MIEFFRKWASGARPARSPEAVQAPEQLGPEIRLFFLPISRTPVSLSIGERELLQHMENGVSVRQLLTSACAVEALGTRTVLSLIEKNVLTTFLGRAGEPWRWRALLRELDEAALPAAKPGGPNAAGSLPEIVRTPLPVSAQPREPPVLTPLPVQKEHT